MDQNTITRRRAIGTGTLFLGAGLLGAAGTHAPVAAAPIADIDRAERLVLELRDVMLRLDERNRFNLGVNLEHLAHLGGVREELIPRVLADYPLMIGPGNRMCDVMDADEAARKRAAVTHPAVVARYAAAYHAGGTDAGTAIRAELASAYGDELGGAIAWAAFDLYLHQKHHGGRGADCCDD